MLKSADRQTDRQMGFQFYYIDNNYKYMCILHFTCACGAKLT